LDEQKIAERFSKSWLRYAGAQAPPAPIWDMIRRHYGEPHRFYHTLNHLNQCLNELDAAKDLIEEIDATEMSIWFHDIIYQYGAKDNESLSAHTFRDLAGPHMEASFVDRVCEFIIATKHTGSAQDLGEAFMVDIDLSGFGLPWEGYLADSNALRQEAPNVSDEQYYGGKLRFLDGLLSWKKLFQTDYFNDRLEAVARTNIKRYSDDLRAQGFAA
jgi:predicted metal-dependent HD superfamily phosphohydrolase